MAVKIVAHDCSLASLAETLRESALSTSIQHPNVVRVCPAAATTAFPCRTAAMLTHSIACWHHAMMIHIGLSLVCLGRRCVGTGMALLPASGGIDSLLTHCECYCAGHDVQGAHSAFTAWLG